MCILTYKYKLKKMMCSTASKRRLMVYAKKYAA